MIDTLLSPGDMVEIETGQGLAYVQVTHRHPSYPEVVRALAGHRKQQPADLEQIASGATAFTALCPMTEILKRNVLNARHVGKARLPDDARDFPTFRTPIRNRNGEVVYWWFWDGQSLRYDATPGPETFNFPLREVIGARELLQRLSSV